MLTIFLIAVFAIIVLSLGQAAREHKAVAMGQFPWHPDTRLTRREWLSVMLIPLGLLLVTLIFLARILLNVVQGGWRRVVVWIG